MVETPGRTSVSRVRAAPVSWQLAARTSGSSGHRVIDPTSTASRSRQTMDGRSRVGRVPVCRSWAESSPRRLTASSGPSARPATWRSSRGQRTAAARSRRSIGARSRWSPAAGFGQQPVDRRRLRARSRAEPRRRRRTPPHHGRGASLGQRAADGPHPGGLLARLHDAACRCCRRPDRAADAAALANDRRRRNLAFRADSLRLYTHLTVKRPGEPPERGGMKRAGRRMMLCIEHNLR